MKILLMMTGGTICTMINANGHLSANTAAAVPLLVEHYRRESDTDTQFEVLSVMNILSENMTFARLNLLLDAFRQNRAKLDACDGVIIAHGTDTLAYTSSLLSLALAG